MTELTLIFVFQVGGILLAVALARLPAPPLPVGAVRRIVSAVERAAHAFVGRGAARVAIAAGLLVPIVVGTGAARGDLHASALGALGVVLGAGLSVVSGWVGATLLARTAGPALLAAERRFDVTLTSTLATGGAAAILAQALGTLGAVGLYWADLQLGGGSGLPAGQAADLARKAASCLPGYALGAGVGALVLEGAAAAYRTAADAGLATALQRDRTLTASDPRNPALVSGMVAETLSAGARTALLFATSGVATATILSLGARVGTLPHDQARFAALPLMIGAFGLVASGAGVWVTRALEAEGAGPALLRGQASAFVISLLGVGGACHWLFPECRLALLGAGAMGLSASASLALVLTLISQRRLPAVRDVADALRAGTAPPAAGALGAGLAAAGVALLLGAGFALGARSLGIGTGLPGGSALGLVTALAGALSLSPFVLAIEQLGAGAASARAVGAMSGATPETTRRVVRLAESSQLPAALAHSVVLVALVLPALGSCLLAGGPQATAAGGQIPTALLGSMILAGATVVLFQAGAVLRRSARGAREATLEVERQLASLPAGTREPGENGATSYRGCEELCGRLGLSAALPAGSIAALGPVMLGIGLVLVYRVGGPRLAADALAMFVAGAAVTALGAALTVDGAHAVLAAARRASRPEGDPATFAASVTGDALLSLLRNAIGPAVCSMALIAASFGLLVLPLLP